ncbi:hypothetical protein Skr01_04360 [Sphaerisporangium krabiense]|nr:hypothetical protein Skr01_04360 [Sphaerisporangium krabiense]
MWLNLAKIDGELLESVRAKPDLIGAIFSEDGQAPAGLPSETDMFGYDYQAFSVIAEARAEAEHEGEGWRTCYPWFAAAIGETGENDIEEYEFGYGPAFVLDPAQVAAIAKGLMAEGWGFGATRQSPGSGAYEGFEDLGPFYAAAARDGKAVVGGVS